MQRSTPIDEPLTRAFRLAFFIHGDKEVALRIAVDALAKLEVAAAAQDKRLYYTPTRRPAPERAKAEGFRTKVSVSEQHLLQRLVYLESEPYERQAEESPPPATLDEEDMIIRFIEHLVKITVKRNSFYVTLGLSRLLHRYSTAETMGLYNVVVQDPGRVRDDYYYRSRKGRLMQELKGRFGDRLRITRGPRGEERFQTDDCPGQHAELVRECLSMFTPWSTACVVPVGLDPLASEISALSFHGPDPDQEHTIEVARFHAVLHPECYQRLTASLNFAPPAERLAVPHFLLAKDRNEERRGPPRPRQPPPLGDAERHAVSSQLAEQSARRKLVPAGWLRIIVDRVERARLDLRRAGRVRLELPEGAELIEVRSGAGEDGLLLATHLLIHDEGWESEQPTCAAIVLEGGQQLSFAVAPMRNAAGEMTGAVVEVSYRETNPMRASTLFLRRLGSALVAAWPGGNLGGRLILKPALVLALLAAVACGLALYWSTRDRAKPPQLVEERPTAPGPERTIPPPQTVGRGAEATPRREARAPAPLPEVARKPEARHPPAPPRPDEAAPVNPDNLPAESEVTRGAQSGSAGVSLLAIKKVHVDSPGGDPLGQQIRDLLIARFSTIQRWSVTASRDEADAVLKLRATAAPAGSEQVVLSARLVNVSGEVIWPTKRQRHGARYQGSAAAIADRLLSDLLAEIGRAERRGGSK